MLQDDERFRLVYAQVVKLWATMEHGTQEEIDAETQLLTHLLEPSEANRES
jgi:hypothetical protein